MRRLVILSSGWGKVDLGWTYLSKSLREKGFDVIWSSYPLRGISSIEESASFSVQPIEALREEYEHITFIGHSMGGLVGRYLIQGALTRPNLIDSYISIATPHQGSPFAYLAPWSKSSQQMQSNSEFLQSLNSRAWPEEIPALSISGGWDFLVSQNSARFWAADDHIHMPKSSHLSLLLNQRVFLELWGWLTYRVFGEVGFDEPIGFSSKIKYA